jgi:hypothetical protein
MCENMSVNMSVNMHVNMSVNMHVNMSVNMHVNMSVNMHVNMNVNMHVNMSVTPALQALFLPPLCLVNAVLLKQIFGDLDLYPEKIPLHSYSTGVALLGGELQAGGQACERGILSD